MAAAADLVNRALELIGQQVTVSGVDPTFDGSVAGDAAGVLYAPVVQLLMRQLNPSFARRTAALVAAGGTVPPPWSQEYTYPADCIRLRQLRPANGSYDINDPKPVRGQVAFDSGLALKVIATNLVGALAVYTSFSAESQFDGAFAESVVRRLSNPLAMALAGRPDYARELLEESDRYAGMTELVDDL